MVEKQKKLKMVEKTVKIPERLGNILWVIGTSGADAQEAFQNLEPTEQIIAVNNVCEAFSSIRSEMMNALLMSAIETMQEIANSFEDDDDEAEGSLH